MPVDGGTSWSSYSPPFSSSNAGYQGAVESIQAKESGYILGGTGNRLMAAERITPTGTSEDQAITGSQHDDYSTVIIPNPARDHAVIRFNLQNGNDVTICLFGSDGRLVYSFRQEHLPAGVHDLPIDLSVSGQPLKPGVYFISLATRDRFYSEKMILVN